MLKSIEESLDKYIDIAARRNRTEKADFESWKVFIMQQLTAKCEIIFRDVDASYHPFLSQEGMEELKRIHQDMVVTYCDKSSHDFVLCCKQVYKRLLWEEVHGDHYVHTSRDNKAIWQDHEKLSDLVGKPPVRAHRYLYGILKMHKSPVGIRWIAGNHVHEEEEKKKKYPACSLSAAESALGGVLRMCMHNLEHKDHQCRKRGYKRYWVVTNVDRVAADM